MSQENNILKIPKCDWITSRNDPIQFKTIQVYETLVNSDITDYKNKIVVLCVEINNMSFMNYYCFFLLSKTDKSIYFKTTHLKFQIDCKQKYYACASLILSLIKEC